MTLSERLSQALTKIRGILPSGDSLDLLQSKGGRRAVIAAVTIYLALSLGLGFYWSMTPDSFDVLENRAKYLKSSCLLYTSPSPRDVVPSRMPSSA